MDATLGFARVQFDLLYERGLFATSPVVLEPLGNMSVVNGGDAAFLPRSMVTRWLGLGKRLDV